MTMKIRSMLVLLCVLVLTGCVSREQADAKLSKACAAGVDVFLGEDRRIDKVNSANFSGSPFGPDFRHVTINAVMLDGWIEVEDSYECIFQESFSLFNSGYTASIHQVRTGDITIGQSGGEIMGNAEDFIKLTDAVRKALYDD